ncbi:MAG: hypothetical protein ACI4WS_03500 [Oscillospiraceae bacterium]
MKPRDYVPFLLSGAAGLMLRTVMADIAGIAYTMNWRDLFNALAGLIICYWLRVLIRAAREERLEQSRSRNRGRRGTGRAARKDKAA